MENKSVPYRVENIVGKGEIAFYKQFLLFSQCFPQLYVFSESKCGLIFMVLKKSVEIVLCEKYLNIAIS